MNRKNGYIEYERYELIKVQVFQVLSVIGYRETGYNPFFKDIADKGHKTLFLDNVVVKNVVFSNDLSFIDTQQVTTGFIGENENPPFISDPHRSRALVDQAV